jgi:hypothetical protein
MDQHMMAAGDAIDREAGAMASSAIAMASASVSPSVTTSGSAGTLTVKPPSGCGSSITVKLNLSDMTVLLTSLESPPRRARPHLPGFLPVSISAR